MNKMYKLLIALFVFLPFAIKAQDSCTAGFTYSNTNLPLSKVFTAQPWHSTQKPVTEICWNFGDGTDTCLIAAPGAVPPLTIQHTYTQPGIYNVCVKIKYQGGCFSQKCSPVQAGNTSQPDSCKADFNVFSTAGAPLVRQFTPLPWHNNNKPVIEVKWTFGDGQQLITTSAVSVTHTYSQPGTYNVCVRIKYDGGCIAEKCKTVVIGTNTQPDSCRAEFIATAANSSPPAGWVFTPQPWHNNNKPVIEVRWNFGDGTPLVTTTTAIPVTHVFTSPGVYNVCIRIKYDGGCIAEKCRTITITSQQADSCKADFNVFDSVINGLKTFVPLPWHNNNKPVIEVRWDFGDGTPLVFTPTATVASHYYANPGTYNVCIRIKYQGGCVAEKCKPVVVNSLPDSCRANFTVVQTSNTTATRTFIAQPWHSNNKPPIQICWKFGDGTDTCLNAVPGAVLPLTISHTYAQPGTYNVCVKIKYQGNCIAEKCNPVTILQPVDSCRADFETSAVASSPLGRKFTALPWNNAGKKPQQVCWQFGDGRDTCINYAETYTGLYTVNHQYNQAGVYTVCVKIKYFGGCIAEKCRPVTISTPPADSCRANFEVMPVAGSILSKTFVAQPWHAQNKRPEKICWNFGDGTDTCINYNPNQNYFYIVTHTYAQPGTYNVCIKIHYQGGCIAEKCKPVVVGVNTQPDSCRADFETATYSSSPRTKRFTALPWHNNNKRPEKICWKFGDGRDTCITYNPANPNNVYAVLHTYAQNGTYNVCVKITYQGGCVAEKCRPVAVGINTQPDSYRANFTEEAVQNIGLWRNFKAIPWHSNGKRPEKICWQFGDGRDTCINYNPAVGTLYQVLHQYSQPGVYNVCVKIKYQGGCEAQYCRPVTVAIAPCRALFTDSMISRFKVKFKGQAIVAQPNNPVVNWQWTFGDGTSGTGQNVVHEYAQPGAYNVCLKITTANGCQNTVCRVKVIDSGVRILQLHPNPVVNTLYITFYSYQNEMAQVKIYNAFGILVRSFARQMTVGYNNFSTDVSTLPTGAYSLVVQTPTALAAGVFFKQ